MKVFLNRLKLYGISLYNKIKYRGINSGIKKRQLTLNEVCKILNVQLPDGIDKKEANMYYNISMKRMFYMTRTLHFTGSSDVTSFKKALIKNGGILVAETPNGNLPTIIVPDLKEAYIKVLSAFRDRIEPTVIAVTGSTGKTSAKNMCISVMKQSIKTFGVKYNMNTYPYCGSLLQCVKDKDKVFVQEVDEGEVGLVDCASRIIKPTYSIVTNSGVSHFKNFKSNEEITANILGIQNGMPENGKIIINADDKALNNANWKCDVITVGFSPNADYYASDIKISDNGCLTYTLNYKGKKQPITLSVIGKHNIYNSMYSFAIADNLSLPLDKTLKGIKSFKTFGVRQNLIKAGKNLLLVDCFNAAPASMKTALDTIRDIKVAKNGKKIAFLSEMSEFGEISEKVHVEVGEYINQTGGIDMLVTFGKYGKVISDNVKRKDIEIIHATDKKQMVELLKSLKGNNNVFLFKASRTVKLEEIIKPVFPIKYFTKIFLSDLLLFHDI